MSDNCILVEECPSVPLEKFQPQVAIAADGAPMSMVQEYIRESAIEFMAKTKLFREMLCIDIEACVCDYFLESSCPDMEVVAIHKICDRELVPQEPCELNDCDGASAWFVPPRSLRITPEPKRDIPESLRVLVSVAPSPDACFLPEALYSHPTWRRAIIDGALAEILDIPGTDFYKPDAAQRRRERAMKRAAAAGVERLMGFGMGPVKLRSRTRYV